MPRKPSGALKDPIFRAERGRMGGLARTSLDHYIGKLVQAAERLTDARREQLAAVLRRDGERA